MGPRNVHFWGHLQWKVMQADVALGPNGQWAVRRNNTQDLQREPKRAVTPRPVSAGGVINLFILNKRGSWHYLPKDDIS